MRLSHPRIRRTGRPITLTFDGMPIPALEGETVAAALSAAGIVALRETQAGAPRGLHCGMGACWDCVVTIDGRIGQRACMTRAADGMVVQRGFPDALAPLGEVPTASTPETLCADVLVVGGGPAGLSAAIAAAEAGAETVLLDERAVTGGQYAKPLAPSHADPAPDPQFALGAALRTHALRAGVRIETDALVWGGFAHDELGVVIRGRAVTCHMRRLILALGAHEAPVPLPGWTLPGVLTTGGLQTLARAQRVLPGHRVLIAGTGPLNLQLACELLDGGVAPVAVLEAAPRPGPQAWREAWQMARAAPELLRDGVAMLLRLKRAGVPVHWGTRLDALEGTGRVARACFGGTRLAVDTVALNQGFQPETGLARALG
ncbi:MAG: (2Fe-2S)-binding protein, partial [Rhodospirillales bacterium]|nr:(2Fe-2S)-binding protein [Rhodospirillales bacterium]